MNRKQNKGIENKIKPHTADVTRLVTCTAPAGGFPIRHFCASNVRRGGRPALDARNNRDPVN